jgi:hypothetical protein
MASYCRERLMADKPTEYIVRLWVDIKVTASTRKEAMEVAEKLPKTTIEGAEIYDEQVADAWPY